jgi:hypothetical protein
MTHGEIMHSLWGVYGETVNKLSTNYPQTINKLSIKNNKEHGFLWGVCGE